MSRVSQVYLPFNEATTARSWKFECSFQERDGLQLTVVIHSHVIVFGIVAALIKIE